MPLVQGGKPIILLPKNTIGQRDWHSFLFVIVIDQGHHLFKTANYEFSTRYLFRLLIFSCRLQWNPRWQIQIQLHVQIQIYISRSENRCSTSCNCSISIWNCNTF